MVGQRLYKIEKLRSEIAIGQLFDRSNPAAQSVMAYPLRAVWTVNSSRLAAMETPSETSRRKVAPCPQFLVSIPKKKLRHAVDRVQMRRRVREAYRLNRHLIPNDLPLDIAFIYVATEVLPYAEVLKGVTRILTRISKNLPTTKPLSLNT
ncbi:MAG: ribonuclease P protein component [Duncaniella sp.]|nr:ribonuclease P protein component [Duncaniella sp.]